MNVEMLTNFQLVNTVGKLAVCPRLLDARAKVSVLQSGAVPIAA